MLAHVTTDLRPWFMAATEGLLMSLIDGDIETGVKKVEKRAHEYEAALLAARDSEKRDRSREIHKELAAVHAKILGSPRKSAERTALIARAAELEQESLQLYILSSPVEERKPGHRDRSISRIVSRQSLTGSRDFGSRDFSPMETPTGTPSESPRLGSRGSSVKIEKFHSFYKQK